MVSQFGSLGYIIMGKIADLTVLQKTIIDTLHKKGKKKSYHGCGKTGCYRAEVIFFNSNRRDGLFFLIIIILSCIIGYGVISVSNSSNK